MLFYCPRAQRTNELLFKIMWERKTSVEQQAANYLTIHEIVTHQLILLAIVTINGDGKELAHCFRSSHICTTTSTHFYLNSLQFGLKWVFTLYVH